MTMIVLGMRFLMELVSVIGIIIGGFSLTGNKKWVFGILIPLIIVIVWSQFGAPNSPRTLKGISKFLLEIVIYGSSILCFYYLFSAKTATIYLMAVIFSLGTYYILGLEGN